MTVRVILACHNRRALTESALRSLMVSAEAAGTPIHVVLFDDGSTDGTADAARAVLPPGTLTVLQGDGSAFWARGMSTAEVAALATADEDDLLFWLNDDVTLHPEGLAALVAVLDGRADRVAVGATTDPESGAVNYGGYVRDGLHPLRFRHLSLTGGPQQIDTLNGNCVLVPVAAARRIGGIDGSFSHGLGDIDYGLRANAAGLAVLLAGAPVGTCPSHPPTVPRPVLREWAAFRSVKGGGHRPSMTRILRRARPRTWPAFVAWSYAAWWGRALPREARRVLDARQR